MDTTFSDAEGRPVVAADTAEDIGEVKGFIVDPTATRIDAIHVSGRKGRADLIAWTSIRSFGPDAVVADNADVDDAVFDAESGEITAVQTSSGRIDAQRLHAVGSYALVVDPD